MKAVVFYEHGGLEKLQYKEDIPKPVYKRDEVLIRVKACALNHLDLFTRNGIPGLKLDMPHIPGSDIAGIIEEVGEGVIKWKVGQKVVINPGYWCNQCEFCKKGEHSLCRRFRLIGEHLPGGYAEYAKVPARNLLEIPDHISFEQAAAGSLALLTAYRMVIKRGQLRLGESIVVLGAGGGVSSFVIQLAKIAGATVYATTSTEDKAEQAKKLGADYVINYKTDEMWWKTIFVNTGKRGVDMVVDSVGEATWDKSIRLLTKGGRLVTCGATTGPMGKTDIRLVFWNQLQIIGSTMASHSEFIEAMN
ncbi:MAG: alcohol dehydrogenase catalytic domain-containing protein, partial [Candidatus Hodarchaeales archaeon]